MSVSSTMWHEGRIAFRRSQWEGKAVPGEKPFLGMGVGVEWRGWGMRTAPVWFWRKCIQKTLMGEVGREDAGWMPGVYAIEAGQTRVWNQALRLRVVFTSSKWLSLWVLAVLSSKPKVLTVSSWGSCKDEIRQCTCCLAHSSVSRNGR